MKGKRIIALLVVVGLAATAIVATVTVQAGHERSEASYDPAGTWIRTTDPAGRLIVSFTPCDPARNKCNIVADGLFDMSWLYEYFGVGPVAAHTKYWGTMVKTGRNTYDYTLVAHGVDENFNILFWFVSAGTMVMRGPDSWESSGVIAWYTPDQDPFGGELPGIWSEPETVAYTRMPIVPPPPLPPEGE